MSQTSIQDLHPILKTYNLGSSQVVDQFEGTNTAYIIQHTSGKYIVKCMTYSLGQEQLDQLIQSCALMDHLHQNGFPCPKPVKNTNGAYVTQHNNSNYHILTHIAGQTDWVNITPHRLNQAGACMGQFHHHQQTFPNLPQPVDLRERITNSLHRIQAEWDQFGMHRSDIRQAAEEALENLNTRWQKQIGLTHGLMHTDATPGNVLFQNDQLTALIDFELIPGTLLFDQCMSVIRWAARFDLQTTTSHLDLDGLYTFINAYHQHRPLPQAEQNILKDTLLLAATWSWGRQRAHLPSDSLWRLTSRGEIYIALSQANIIWPVD